MLHSTVLITHSVVRYFVLIFLIVSLVRSFMGWRKKSAFTGTDDRVSLWLLILTHTQFFLGLTLYFVSPLVIFSAASMKDSVARYWLVEHISMMVIAVALITVGRATSKKLPSGEARHKRLFIFNIIAVIIILVAIAASGRGFFSLPAY